MEDAKGRVQAPDSGVLLKETDRQLNTAKLGQRIIADVSSAATAASLVAPIICVIDR